MHNCLRRVSISLSLSLSLLMEAFRYDICGGREESQTDIQCYYPYCCFYVCVHCIVVIPFIAVVVAAAAAAAAAAVGAAVLYNATHIRSLYCAPTIYHKLIFLTIPTTWKKNCKGFSLSLIQPPHSHIHTHTPSLPHLHSPRSEQRGVKHSTPDSTPASIHSASSQLPKYCAEREGRLLDMETIKH